MDQEGHYHNERRYKMKNTTLLIIAGIVIVLVGAFIFLNKGQASVSGEVISGDNQNAQKITLSMKNSNYYPNTITVKANQPVEITLDNSVRGCYRSFTIRELGVSKYSKTPEETIIFTPTKTGTFRFACSMGMGTGTIVVN